MNELLPPTVPVPLSVLLGDPGLGLRRLAGPGGEVSVHSVHTSEMADPVPYLLGGELLLSAGVHTPPTARDPGPAARWERYVCRTVEAGAAALGLGIAPVHETVPHALVDACERHGLPLVEVPRGTPFTAVAHAMWQAVAERRHRGLRRAAEAQQALAGAAARPHPVAAVLRQLAQHLGGWVALLGPDGAELAAAGTRPPEPARTALGGLAVRLRAAPSSATTSLAGSGLRLSAFGLSGPGAAGQRLALGVCSARHDPADATITGVGAVLLSLLTAPRTVTADADRTAALVRLMLGESPADVAPLLAAPGPGEAAEPRPGPRGPAHPPPAGPAEGSHASGSGGGGRSTRGSGDGALWTVVHGRRRGSAGDGGLLAGAELAAGLGTGLVDLDRDGAGFRALVPGTARVEARRGWTIGAGEPVPAEDLSRGDAGAARALRRALAERAPLVRQQPGAGMAGLVAPDDARAHARVRLAPLAGAPALVETLRVWLSLHGSWDRTAVALEIHRNTVRQRISRAAGLLGGADLTDPDVRMDLWFALAWYEEPDGRAGRASGPGA